MSVYGKPSWKNESNSYVNKAMLLAGGTAVLLAMASVNITSNNSIVGVVGDNDAQGFLLKTVQVHNNRYSLCCMSADGFLSRVLRRHNG